MKENPGKNPCIVLPTGTGKSIVAAELCRQVVSWGGRVLVLAHRLELIRQNAEKAQALLPIGKVGIHSAGLGVRDTEQDILIAQVQSVHKFGVANFQRRDLIVIDEAHLISPNENTMYRQIIDTARVVTPRLRVVGLTATPYRLDTGAICTPDGPLHGICYELGIREAIEKGYLCNLVSRVGKSDARANLSDVHTRGGEFVTGELSRAMRFGGLVDRAVDDMLARAQGRHTGIVFCVDLEHVESVRACLDVRGESVASLHGGTPPLERQYILSAFKSGSIRWLVNCEVATTGLDVPSIDVIALMRPTKSAGLFVQMVGRGLRLHPSKTDCAVLDYGNLLVTHGPVDLITAKSGTRGQGGGEAPKKTCPHCSEQCHVSMSICPNCGGDLPTAPKHEDDKHEDKPSDAPVLSSGKVFEDEVIAIGDTTWERHMGKSGMPVLKVSYWKPGESPTSITSVRRRPEGVDWVCIEHDGFALMKAEKWWALRSNDPFPESVNQAVRIFELGGVAPTTSITVRTWRDKKYPEIVNHTVGEKPEVELSRLESAVESLDDLPF